VSSARSSGSSSTRQNLLRGKEGGTSALDPLPGIGSRVRRPYAAREARRAAAPGLRLTVRCQLVRGFISSAIGVINDFEHWDRDRHVKSAREAASPAQKRAVGAILESSSR